jgi:hypothetical protein
MEKDKDLIEETFYDANPIYTVAKRLEEEGYSIAGHMGIRREMPTCNMIGILKDRKPVEKSLLGIIKWKKNQKALHLGTVWFNHIEKDADEYERWVFEANGIKEMSKLTNILEEVSLPYKVKIQSVLYNNVPKRETYLHELGD